MPPRKVTTVGVLNCFGLQIGDVDRLSVEDGSSHDDHAREGQRILGGDRSMLRCKAEQVAVHLKDRRIVGIAEASRTCCDLCEDAMRIGWCVRDRRQNLSCSSLLLPRLGEFSLKLLLRSATNLICARHRDFGRHGPYQSGECSGEIVSMTLSQNAILR